MHGGYEVMLRRGYSYFEDHIIARYVSKSDNLSLISLNDYLPRREWDAFSRSTLVNVSTEGVSLSWTNLGLMRVLADFYFINFNVLLVGDRILEGINKGENKPSRKEKHKNHWLEQQWVVLGLGGYIYQDLDVWWEQHKAPYRYQMYR